MTDPKPSAAIFKQTLLSLCISMSYLIIGLVRGYSATAIPSINQLHPEILPNKDIISWIGSIPPFGAFIGSLLAAPIMHFIGRRNTVLVAVPVFTVGWLTISFSVSWIQMLIGRFLTGFGAGLCLPSAQIYVTECSNPKIRGVIGSFPAVFMSGGILASYILGSILPWNILAWISAGCSGLVAFLLFFLPESPIWLRSKNRIHQANAAIKWLHLDPVPEMHSMDNNNVELQQMMKNGDTNKNLPDAKVIEKDNNQFDVKLLKPLIIGLFLLTIQQVSGIDAIIFFTVDIFRSSGSSFNEHIATISTGSVQLIANIISLFIIDKCGRKPLLIGSALITAMATALMGIAFYLNDLGNTKFGYLPLISLMLFMIGYSIGFGCIPFLLMGELFPAQQRGLFSSIAGSFNLAVMFIVIKTYHPLEGIITTAGTFWMYSIFCILGVLFVIFFVPETKGRRLESIANLFTIENKLDNKLTYNFVPDKDNNAQ